MFEFFLFPPEFSTSKTNFANFSLNFARIRHIHRHIRPFLNLSVNMSGFFVCSVKTLSYDKILFGMDVFAPPGDNILAFVIGGGRNETIFDGCLPFRDSGDVGTIVVDIVLFQVLDERLMFLFSFSFII